MDSTSSQVQPTGTMPIGPHHNLLTPKIAFDCDMMRSNIGQVLGRVSVVNYNNETIFDAFVSYPDPIGGRRWILIGSKGSRVGQGWGY